MDVKRLMKLSGPDVRTGRHLNTAAQIMWEGVCGSVPVVDGDSRPIGFLTDRDICMAAYKQGWPLVELTVEGAMARSVLLCGSEDDLARAAQLMRDNALRRLPVIDGSGVLTVRSSLNGAQDRR